MTVSIVSRADLLRGLNAAAPDDRPRVAELLGFKPDAQPTPTQPEPESPRPPPFDREPVATPTQPSAPPAGWQPVPFWQPVRFARRQPEEAPPAFKGYVRRPRATEPPVFQVLAPWRALLPRFRRLLTTGQPIGDVDVDHVVGALGRGRQLDRMPLEERRRWPAELHIILDRSDRLTPFWEDQTILARALSKFLNKTRVRVAVVDELMETPRFLRAKERYAPPGVGGVVLVLGDLGCLDRGPAALEARWLEFGHRIVAAGANVAALIPGPLARCPPALRRLWNTAPWEAPGPELPQDPASRGERADRLLGLLSSCVRIEPGLLRAVRRSLPATLADAGTEADAWQHHVIESPHCDGASLRQDDAAPLARVLLEADETLQRQVLAVREQWRHSLPDEIWYLEVLGLPAAARGSLPNPADFEAACSFFETLRHSPDLVANGPGRADAWLEEARRHVAPPVWEVAAFAAAAGSAAQRGDPQVELPAGLDPAWLDPIRAERSLTLWLEGSGIRLLEPDSALPGAGSVLATICTCNDLVSICLVELTIEDSGVGDLAFWAAGRPPAWAESWGRDEFGPWVTFSLAGADGGRVVQHMRWMEAGSFQMGSLKDKEGRYDDEGPRHLVTIEQGFWIFDTACSEALWDAVMGLRQEEKSLWEAATNSVRLASAQAKLASERVRRGAGFPITDVSWDDAQVFLQKLNKLKPGLDLSLPSEAQWEYACRAGTATPYSFGTRIDHAQVCYEADAPVEVGSLPPNRWGLSEMHGNVWEWCVDAWHGNYEQAPTDGSARASEGAADRVVRGGSWFDGARGVRAASRGRFAPTDRGGGVGFRCARVQSAGGASGAEPADPASRVSPEGGRPQGPPGGAGLLRAGVTDPVVIPPSIRLVLRSDREELHLRRLIKPDWASAIGRDTFGLFTEITIPDTEITQRMRWIPPGWFWMGSSDDEPGRFDDERPRHEVTLQDGFWLFDTPCTQAWWQVVMDGKNPSRFQTPDRPVERVSFDDVQEFLSRLNKRAPGLNLGLPSEAQWEYACRAGTETATYAGALGILGENNAPALDPIAWYGGNSGVGFELDDGHDASGWPNKQYDHAKAGTHPNGLKLPNPWGLHDMLGNVFEWCADVWHDSYERAPTDGSARTGEGAADRVIRGGSWYVDARRVRAAFRALYGPSDRLDSLGFRCARVQASVQASAERRAGRSKQGERSEPAATTGPKRRDGGGTRVKSAPTRS